jgi:hypothetical protein
MATEPITLRAHAKLTLSLKMTGVRPDGFHLIDAEMISLDLHDVLVFDPNRIGLAVAGTFSDGAHRRIKPCRAGPQTRRWFGPRDDRQANSTWWRPRWRLD